MIIDKENLKAPENSVSRGLYRRGDDVRLVACWNDGDDLGQGDCPPDRFASVDRRAEPVVKAIARTRSNRSPGTNGQEVGISIVTAPLDAKDVLFEVTFDIGRIGSAYPRNVPR